jgi:hypothetical protein
MGPWLVDVRQREDFDPWLDGTAPVSYRPVVMVVRGDVSGIREFLPNALDAAKLAEERVVVWVKDSSILTAGDVERFFNDDDAIIASVLSVDHEVKAWVYSDATDVDDADFAFSEAKVGG